MSSGISSAVLDEGGGAEHALELGLVLGRGVGQHGLGKRPPSVEYTSPYLAVFGSKLMSPP